MRALQVGGGLPRRGKAGSESSWRPQVGQPVALEHGTNNRLQFVHVQIPSLFSPESPAAARGVAGGGGLFAIGRRCLWASESTAWWKELEENAVAECVRCEQKPREKLLLWA